MSVKNVVKVMNFHALLRVNGARRKVEKAYKYERELLYVISMIINNRIFNQEHLSIKFPEKAKDLNIYIGSDLGFCASFNSDIEGQIELDNDENDKIIIGKRIKKEVNNVLLFMEKDQFLDKEGEILDIVLDGIMSKRYSNINIIYIHYYNLNKQELIKRKILPVDFDKDIFNKEDIKVRQDEDFVIEGDLNFILWNLISEYVRAEIKIAESWSWASENVKRQMFTNESLKKIEEKEEEDSMLERKARHSKDFKVIVEINNKKNRGKKEEE